MLWLLASRPTPPARPPGLDWVWPLLLGFPHDRIAVIDAVCCTHPRLQADSKQRLYSVPNPYGPSPMDEFAFVGEQAGRHPPPTLRPRTAWSRAACLLCSHAPEHRHLLCSQQVRRHRRGLCSVR